jgi:hypothetical protein
MGRKVKVGDDIELAGVTYFVKKVGKWECIVAATNGSKRFPRTPTVQRMVAEKDSGCPDGDHRKR